MANVGSLQIVMSFRLFAGYRRVDLIQNDPTQPGTASHVVTITNSLEAVTIIAAMRSVFGIPDTQPENPAAVLGRAGRKVGGPARAARLTAQQRSDIARHAAEARWGKKKGDR